ncbi:lysoplasmalogenase [Microbacterium sp. zg.B48]|uniref:lysoplasmalogenase n=1 Tax=Microbacterium sp. zg.B48 TaxID=2969408 RepID=UPI00214BEAEC|nr:lysoplasmalogenase [Microbacterium sp. zg.B48]MCR2763326.1 lysoplasmalogenase [Microbacterium sp. zg.B48]
MNRLWIGFVPFGLVSAVHVGALAAGVPALAGPTKLLLMPLLAAAVLWGGRGSRWGLPYTLLFAAIAFSWLGDGAGTFFAAAPTVPMMLLFFGVAHLCYIWLFWRLIPVRRVPAWAAVYGLWWIALLAVLWPHLGGLLIPVAVYGLVLGGTAVAASRCHPLVTWGGAFFLASDTVLAFRLFLPDATPDWASPVVMLTYCAGQGLIAGGVVVADRLVGTAARRERAGTAG